MGKWEKQQFRFKEVQERNKVTRETVAKYFLDLSKLVFAAIVLGGFTPMFTEKSVPTNWLIIIVGVISTLCLGILGYRILKMK